MPGKKPKIDRGLLEQVAKNARLKLSKKEVDKFLPQLKDIIETFSALEDVDISKTEPSFQPISNPNIFREDRTGNCLSQEEALSNTKHKKKGYFKGPKVVE